MTDKIGLKEIRSSKKVSQAQVSSDLNIPIRTYQAWEQGINRPKSDNLVRLADYFGVTTDEIIGRKPSDQRVQLVSSPSVKVPLYGRIAAGEDAEMIEAIEQVDIMKRVYDAHPRAFLLQVAGDSMNKVVLDGHYALIDPDAEINNGDVVAVNVNGFDATLKRITREPESIMLSPDSHNLEYRSRVIHEGDPDAPSVRILGKMVWQTVPF